MDLGDRVRRAMNGESERMATSTIIARVALQASHVQTGRTRHYAAGTLLPKPAHLMIVRFSESEFNLIHLSADGTELTDTFHETVEDAMTQAEFEFEVGSTEWIRLEESY